MTGVNWGRRYGADGTRGDETDQYVERIVCWAYGNRIVVNGGVIGKKTFDGGTGENLFAGRRATPDSSSAAEVYMRKHCREDSDFVPDRNRIITEYCSLRTIKRIMAAGNIIRIIPQRRLFISIASMIAAIGVLPRGYDRDRSHLHTFNKAAIEANDYARPIIDIQPGQSQFSRLVFYELSL